MNKTETYSSIRPMGAGPSLLIFATAACLMWCVTRFAIPWLSLTAGMETVFWWFVAAGTGVFLPLILTSVFTGLTSSGPYTPGEDKPA